MTNTITITPLKAIPEFSPIRNILICPSGFKESLDPAVAADCIEIGIRRAMPNADIVKAPMVDGGEGFTTALVEATGGELRFLEVTGPVGEPVKSHFGFLGPDHGSKTAIIEMAAAAGLSLVPRDQRQPLNTTTYGVGQLVHAALEEGADHILFGCGDSGTCDGGVGMAQALGARFYARDGTEISPASGAIPLVDLASVDVSGLHPRLAEVEIDVACNWHNVLCGPSGVARVFGPQKGASPADVERLETAMVSVAAVVEGVTGRDVSHFPGGGASGGLGAGLLLIGATLHPRFDIITKYLKLDHLIANADIVFTAEGGIDYQTPRGKIPAEVARRAMKYDIPVVALAGTIGDGANVNYSAGIHAYASIMQKPTSLENAIAEAEVLLTEAAENMMRTIIVGSKLGRPPSPENKIQREKSKINSQMTVRIVRRSTVL
jgi:glycerate 2-kinase